MHFSCSFPATISIDFAIRVFPTQPSDDPALSRDQSARYVSISRCLRDVLAQGINGFYSPQASSEPFSVF
jgi:hypothetical protein